jgi:N-acetylglutamate synthase-like GNAT family acetyltransferase
MDVTLRRATVGDQAAITALVRRARLNPRGLSWPGFVVARAGADIVGVAQIRPHPDGARELASLVVRPDMRGQGIGTRLVDALLAEVDGPVYTLVDEPYVNHFRRWRFRPVAPAALPSSLRRQYRIGRIVTSVTLVLRMPRVRIVPLLRDSSN